MRLQEYIAAQQHRANESRAVDLGSQIASLAGRYVAQAIAHVAQVDTASSRALSGVTTGAQDAAALGALGASIGGAYGLAIGAALGAIEGGIRGAWPNDRQAVISNFQTMIRDWPPPVRMRLWPYFKLWGAVAREGDGNPPLGQWRTIDEVNVNLFGSNQWMVAALAESLILTECFPRFSTNAAMRFDQLPAPARYAIGCLVARYDDANLVANTPDLGNIYQTGNVFNSHYDVSALDPTRRYFQPDLRPWVQGLVEQSDQGLTCAMVRQSLETVSVGGSSIMPDITKLPDDLWTKQFLADPRGLVT